MMGSCSCPFALNPAANHCGAAVLVAAHQNSERAQIAHTLALAGDLDAMAQSGEESADGFHATSGS